MKRLFIIFPALVTGLFLFSLLSCEKGTETSVLYRATDANAPFTVTYRTETGELLSVMVPATSTQDEWTYSFPAAKGEIVYLSAHYSDITSGITLSILLNGKVYKESSSRNDTLSFLIVSGTIPY